MPPHSPAPEALLGHLRELLSEYPNLLIAYSGGVDSTFLVAVAAEVLGPRAVAATVRSVLNPPGELAHAVRVARELGVAHHVVDLDPLADEHVARNPPDRCYHCKRAVFACLRHFADAQGLGEVAHAEHVGDLGQRRPGQRAAAELGIRAPLVAAGLDKPAIRHLSQGLGLPGWDRPAMACLASRVPYGERLTPAKLSRISQAEDALRALGLRELRVRDHGTVARVELGAGELAAVAQEDMRTRVVQLLKAAGYAYVTLDLEGLRSGSMDEVL